MVDLTQGVWCQRCFDPDCRGYRSEAMPLPTDVWQAACTAFVPQSVLPDAPWTDRSEPQAADSRGVAPGQLTGVPEQAVPDQAVPHQARAQATWVAPAGAAQAPDGVHVDLRGGRWGSVEGQVMIGTDGGQGGALCGGWGAQVQGYCMQDSVASHVAAPNQGTAGKWDQHQHHYSCAGAHHTSWGYGVSSNKPGKTQGMWQQLDDEDEEWEAACDAALDAMGL